jgi:periplasmic divalent cation tolerance protein
VGALVVVTTVGTEEQAILIARELVCRRHAACVNIVPGVRSIYRWQGKVCRDSEFLLVVKSEDAEYPAIESAIRELHSYELPEILAFKVAKGEPNFLGWIATSLDKTQAPCDPDDEIEDSLVPLDETNY